MDRPSSRRARGIEDALSIEITLRGRRRTDADTLVRFVDVARVAIGFRKHGNGTNAEATKRGLDPTRDFAAVGDEHLGEHEGNSEWVGSGIPDEETHGRRVVGVAGIVELWTVRDEHRHVHFGAKLDVATGG